LDLKFLSRVGMRPRARELQKCLGQKCLGQKCLGAAVVRGAGIRPQSAVGGTPLEASEETGLPVSGAGTRHGQDRGGAG